VEALGPVSWTPPFQSHLVLDEHILEARLRAYYVGFDQRQFRLQALADVIISVVPEFALGFYQGPSIPLASIVPRLREAARRIYSTDKYQTRGEFGELILHLLLRDFCRSVPLVSKINFKDADNSTVHGFDAVHVVADASTRQLWLGESKLYDNGPSGIQDLLEDLRKHLTADYLRREFALISPKLPGSFPDIEHWRTLLHEHQPLDSVFQSVWIPMLCTFSSTFHQQHSDNTQECLEAFASECRALHHSFEHRARPAHPTVNILLLLLPIASKAQLVETLHQRLRAMQAI